MWTLWREEKRVFFVVSPERQLINGPKEKYYNEDLNTMFNRLCR